MKITFLSTISTIKNRILENKLEEKIWFHNVKLTRNWVVIPRSYTNLQSIRRNLTGNPWDTKFISFVFHIKYAIVFKLNQSCFNWIIDSRIYFHPKPLNWKILNKQKYLYRISSVKRTWHLFNFETFRYGAYWRAWRKSYWILKFYHCLL